MKSTPCSAQNTVLFSPVFKLFNLLIKIHFVQNAEEVISAAMNRIDEIKEKEKRSRVVAQATANAPASTSDKLKDLLAMKESGLITEEEFTKKREEILSNM